ncbi:choice-of-anchor Q domain-containing protein [Paraliomyxa miuraensis]|uniref:choice-of-anchor Q domain-containing protein n=1 Tax=Paraliomyxa miuraensis TaxID=376150 RepID=UPI00224E3776|nr:choice-of-anchor Q domain-containing protein [Paraliomyxa miuraensis]MCX4242012.1 hypothetical protein [Paraliomyxa miuraensis]
MTWLGAESIAAAAPCYVTDPSTSVAVPGSLPYCVDQVNLGLTDHVVIQAFHWYAPNAPLVFERSARLSGLGRIVMPGDEFVGDSLFVVGTPCPGPSCQGQVQVEIEGLEIAAVGVTGVRGIDVRPGHELWLEYAQLYEFSVLGNGSNGGCVRAGQQSVLTIVASTFEGCMADDGGAVFTEATSTEILGSSFTGNLAAYNGGAIAVGTANFFARTLGIEGSSFESNFADWGGAIKAAGTQVGMDVIDTQFLGNIATSRGGGVHGKGTFELCRFEGNEAQSFGGGLHLTESSTVASTTLWSNGAIEGGGVAFRPGSGATLVLEGSTLAHNAVKGDGARGAGLATLGGVAIVRNATLSNNVANDDVASSYGGGVSVANGKASLQHVTLADNRATAGGGIHIDATSELSLLSSIVATSTGGDCELLGGHSSVTSLDTDGTCSVTFSGVDPQLDALGDNGGPTWTRWPGAPEVIDVAQCHAAVDQRNEPRPEDKCDIGALEP